MSDPKAYLEEFNITLDQNKSLMANFCTKCGDVNGDLMITPADAQAAFEIFLGKNENPTFCEKENADVDTSGTKTNPEITPGDAQSILNRFLSQDAFLSNCSGISRNSSTINASMTKMKNTFESSLVIDTTYGISGEIIEVHILVDNPYNMDAFGFDLLYPSEQLEFIILQKSELTEDFNQLEANKIVEGKLRVGGYRIYPIMNQSPSILITLLFRAIGDADVQTLFSIVNTVDDFENANIRKGTLFPKVH